MSNIVGKIELIREISRYHPGYNAGQTRGWSWYIGGMYDKGGWNFWKMFDEASYADLRICLIELEEESNPKPIVLSEKDRIKLNTIVVLNGAITNQLEIDSMKKFGEKLHSTLLWGSHH